MVERSSIREKVLAQLISLTVQLKYLQIEQFEWLLHVIQYVSLPFINDLLVLHSEVILITSNDYHSTTFL